MATGQEGKSLAHISALHLLMALGYEYLAPEQALILRGGKAGEVVLGAVLEPWLKEHNAVPCRTGSAPFTHANIRQALRLLTAAGAEPGAAGAGVYELLTRGTRLAQTVDGEAGAYPLHYVDWQHPERNVYHVGDEYPVLRAGRRDSRRVDIVLFVNGIPLAAIACGRPGHAPAAVSDLLRCQQPGETPHLFHYTQLLLALAVDGALYATAGTPGTLWSAWREEGDDGNPADLAGDLRPLLSRRLHEAEKRRLCAWRADAPGVRAHFDALEAAGERPPTAQDRALYALLRPERLLELAGRFVVHDGAEARIARPAQFFAVQRALACLSRPQEREACGGLIWHASGSGRAFTLLLLARAFAQHPAGQGLRLLVVTSCPSLRDRLGRAFAAIGRPAALATSPAHLRELLPEGGTAAVITGHEALDAAVASGFGEAGSGLLVLVDDALSNSFPLHIPRLRRALPHARIIGISGTPPRKDEAGAVQQIGGWIHRYAARQAVADGAIVPLLYERREIGLEGDEEGRLQRIALDLGEHYRRNWRGTGFKALLAAPGEAAALRYQRALEGLGLVTSALLLPPAVPGQNEEAGEAGLAAFRQDVRQRYGGEEAYRREVLAGLARADGVELLIVSGNLLAELDEPRLAVLYIDRPLQGHALLQAVARANRPRAGKEFAHVVDYCGVLGEFAESTRTFSALQRFDAEDVAGVLTPIAAEFARLPQRHATLWAIFGGRANPRDPAPLLALLAVEEVRGRFYAALAAYTRTLKVALGAACFQAETPPDRIAALKRDMAFFHSLRAAVRQRYGESPDEREEGRGRLLDRPSHHYRAAPGAPQEPFADLSAAVAPAVVAIVARLLATGETPDPYLQAEARREIEAYLADVAAGRGIPLARTELDAWVEGLISPGEPARSRGMLPR